MFEAFSESEVVGRHIGWQYAACAGLQLSKVGILPLGAFAIVLQIGS